MVAPESTLGDPPWSEQPFEESLTYILSLRILLQDQVSPGGTTPGDQVVALKVANVHRDIISTGCGLSADGEGVRLSGRQGPGVATWARGDVALPD